VVRCLVVRNELVWSLVVRCLVVRNELVWSLMVRCLMVRDELVRHELVGQRMGAVMMRLGLSWNGPVGKR